MLKHSVVISYIHLSIVVNAYPAWSLKPGTPGPFNVYTITALGEGGGGGLKQSLTGCPQSQQDSVCDTAHKIRFRPRTDTVSEV